MSPPEEAYAPSPSLPSAATANLKTEPVLAPEQATTAAPTATRLTNGDVTSQEDDGPSHALLRAQFPTERALRAELELQRAAIEELTQKKVDVEKALKSQRADFELQKKLWARIKGER